MIATARRLLLRPMRSADTGPLLGITAGSAVMTSFAAEPFDQRRMARWVEDNLAHHERHGYGL